MRTLTGVIFLSASVFLLAACGAQSTASAPASPATQQSTPAGDTGMMDDAATADAPAETSAEAPMAEKEMVAEGMSGDAMAATSTADDSMAEDTMAEDEMAGESMSESADHAAMTDGAAGAEVMDDHAMDGESMVMEDTLMTAERPAWQQIPLTDARTGATFTLADFAGKTVFVEPFATWCSNCRQQLGHVQAARSQLGDDVVFVTLSVESNIGDEALVKYTEETGFDWTFAAMPPEMLQALAGIFGQTIANPPATPHFIIRSDGSVTDLVTGIEDAETIRAAIAAAQGG